MTEGSFLASRSTPALAAELSASAPGNPFATPEFLEARRRSGCEPWVLGYRDAAGAIVWGCGAFLRTGRLNRTLEIISLPALNASSPFWARLQEFCQQGKVTRLALYTFGSPEGIAVPQFPYESSRRLRCEFSLDLGADLDALMDAKHRREVRKAIHAGLAVTRLQAGKGLREHLAAIESSMDRRRGRGEEVRATTRAGEQAALLEAGAAEIFQAVRGTEILSSALVLRSREGGYLHTAGTTALGMNVGASHFLMHRISQLLRAEGASVFALGGAEEGSGLARFKSRFGARRIHLPEVTCYVGPAWRRTVDTMLEAGRAKVEMLMTRSSSSK